MIRRRAMIKRSPLKHGIPKGQFLKKSKGDLKKEQRRAYKLRYCKDFGEKLEDDWRGRCQHAGCRQWRFMRQADFSHKVPAGRGGDKGGMVQATNGVFSCRPCHDFVEQDQVARQELIASEANIENGQPMVYTADTEARRKLFVLRLKGL